MLKINGLNIGQIRINGFDIKLGKINNQIIFEQGSSYGLAYSSYVYIPTDTSSIKSMFNNLL